MKIESSPTYRRVYFRWGFIQFHRKQERFHRYIKAYDMNGEEKCWHLTNDRIADVGMGWCE